MVHQLTRFSGQIHMDPVNSLSQDFAGTEESREVRFEGYIYGVGASFNFCFN